MSNIFKRKIYTFLLMFACFFSTEIFASVNTDLGNFFNNVGYQDNVTSAAAYQGQAAGYYTGGSLYLRDQVKDYQLVSIQLPSFSAGCSGIDSYLGAFSVINSKQLMYMVKNIMSAGGAYAFDLALTTTIPQIRSVKDYIQQYVNGINSEDINSCTTGEDLVGGMWPKTQEAQQQICRDVGSHNGLFTDWAAARQGCGTGGQFNQGIGNGGGRQAEVLVNKNVVWDALEQNGFSASHPEMSEFLMNLTGSIIMRDTPNGGGAQTKVTIPSYAHDRNLIKALLHGGTVQIWGCDEYKKCLYPTKNTTITISDTNALIPQVANMIATLNFDVLHDSGALTPSVRGFLEMTPIPILKFISNEAELGQPLDTTQYSEVIAISLLNQYFMENINLVQEALSQEDTPMTSTMSKQITADQIEITHELTISYKKLQNTMMLVDNMRVMEQQLASRLADRAAVAQEK